MSCGTIAVSDAWKILLVMTFARMTMGFQFQAVAALASDLTGPGGISFTALGVLAGVYLLPGAAVALIGGWLAQRVGAARVAFVGLGLMTIGGGAGWLSNEYQFALIWRAVAGIGAVALNVMGTKMVADWFEGRVDLPTAMGVFVSSWPAGIAIATLTLPVFSRAFGLDAALLLPAVLCVAGWLLLWMIWREPRRTTGPALQVKARFYSQEWVRVILAGLIWAIYNVALIGAIAWTPGLLENNGFSTVTAAAATSVIGWTAIFSVAAGGWLAARSPHRDIPALICFLASAVFIGVLPFVGMTAGSIWTMAAVGLAIGPAAATIMVMPVEAARPELRSLSMGIYFAIYYAVMGVGPAIYGVVRDASGWAGAPIVLAAGLLLLCIPLWWLFRRLQSKTA